MLLLHMKLISAMPAEKALKRGIDIQEAQCKELLTKVQKTLDERTPKEGDVRKHQGHLEYALRNLTDAYKQLQDHYYAREDVSKEDLDAHYTQQRDGILPLEDMLREVKLRAKPRESSSRNWWPFKLETFTGEIGKFRSFMDNFEATIDKRTDLHEVDKLNILKGHLKGDPYILVNTFEATAKNYRSVKEILQSRYGNQLRYELNLAKELTDLKPPSHHLKELNRFHSIYEATLRSMENAGCDLKACEWLFIRILKSKIREETWSSLNNLCDMESCDLAQFRKNYQQMLTRMESMPKDAKVQSTTTASKEEKENIKSYSGKHKTAPQKQKGYWHREDVGNYHISSKDDSPKSVKKKKTVDASPNSTSTQEGRCMLCSGNHHYYYCSTYATFEERQRRTVQLKRCVLCFKKHDTSGCTMNLQVCGRCKQGKHHALFCQGASSSTHAEDNPQVAPVILHVDAGRNLNNGAVPTAQAIVSGPGGPVSTRVFFDFGAQRTFVSANLIKQLTITPTEVVEMTIDGFTGPWPKQDYEVVTLNVSIGDKSEKINAIVVERLPGGIRTKGLKETLGHLKGKGLKMADPNLTKDVVPDLGILLGTDSAFTFFKGATTIDNINLFETTGGYAIAGPLPSEFCQPEISVTSVMVANVNIKMNPVLNNPTVSEVEKYIPQLWELESIGIQKESYTPEEATAYGAYSKSVLYQDNQYWVKLPWKVDKGYLPTNFHLAKQRLQSTLNKLEKNPKHLELYEGIIKEQEEKGFTERVKGAQVTQSTHYLPHLAVIKNSKTTPIRIVFDCSAKQDRKSNSLNDCLYSGPSLTEKLGKVLVKFRTNPFAFAADISKAFLRVGLQEEDRDFTRFLWPEDPNDPKSRLVTYRFRSVLFGATSSPFLLQATLTHHLDKSENCYAEQIKESLYVDNLQGTVLSEKELLDFYGSANQTMAEANMPLQSWCTNSVRLQEVMNIEQDEDQKLLGIKWNVKRDELNIVEPEFDSGPLTKRKLLSSLSRVFDPLGLLSPLTISARVLMQETWKHQLDWDSILPGTIQEQWETIAKGLKGLSQISFPRETCHEGKIYDLHVFCDASPKAYGAVAYVTDGVQVPQIIMAKAKVAPVKTKTLPQLELTALYVGVKLQQYVRDTMIKIQFKEVLLWSDSEVALWQVKNNNSKKIYVRNRVAAINEIGPHCILQHVKTEHNPADLLTRGMSVKKLKEANHWFHGPSWLNSREDWPAQKMTTSTQCSIVAAQASEEHIPLFDGSEYSRSQKLFRATELVFKFINNCKKEDFISVTPINYWLKIVQGTEFSEELKFLKGRHRKAPELVRKLGLFLEDGIIRCKGRINNSELSYSAKFPVLLPKKHWFTRLLIEDAHRRAIHGGVQDTLCKMREQFWVPQGRQSVKTVLSKCYICKRLEGPSCDYPSPPPLPSFRVDKGTPFLTTGVDYTGALNITDPVTGDTRKVYVVLFTCANTRAVHLELALDLTAETFLNVFRRFVARRSCPQLMISDNGKYFKLSASLLQQIIEDARVKKELEERGCTWKFIPPRSPWQGGFYERLIGVTKSCLKKTLFRKKVSIEDLYTLVAEVENRVNNRPLTYVSDDINELEALTPSHLIYGRRLKSLPSVTRPVEDDPGFLEHQNLNERYQKLSHIINKWQDTWKKDYLVSIREKFYGVAPSRKLNRTLKDGDVVVVQGLGPRAEWPLGRVEETYPDEKGAVRLVKLRMKTGTALRTVDKLFPLECEVDQETASADNDDSEDDDSEDFPEQSEEGGRPSRRAAVRFRNRLRNMINSGELA